MSKSTERRRKMPAPLSDDPFADDRGLAKRKLRQLCAQAERAVGVALWNDCGDPVLLDMFVQSVLPWPNATRLLVVVEPSNVELEIDRADILARLEAVKGTLRSAVAEAIHRKRAPELCFEIFRPEIITND
jgi:ribosome-binding factor A